MRRIVIPRRAGRDLYIGEPPGDGPICYLSARKVNAQIVMRDVSAGTGWPIHMGGRYWPHRPACFYGVNADTLHQLQQAQRSRQPWYYIDHAYFGRGDYYRVTKNAVQHSGTGDSTGERWQRLGIEIQPWRTGGTHILVCPQSKWWHEWFMGDTPEAWADRIVAELRQYTDRPIVVRHKPVIATGVIGGAVAEAKRQLDEALTDCWAVVVHQSGVGIQAALAGVPVFATGAGAVSPMALSDLSQIESPIRPEGRHEWASVLADNQWSQAEIRGGALLPSR